MYIITEIPRSLRTCLSLSYSPNAPGENTALASPTIPCAFASCDTFSTGLRAAKCLVSNVIRHIGQRLSTIPILFGVGAHGRILWQFSENLCDDEQTGNRWIGHPPRLDPSLSLSSSLVGSTQPLFSALSSEREGKFNHAYSCPLRVSRSRGYRDRRCYLQLGACSPKSGINYLSRSCPSRLCHKRTWKRAAGNSRNVSCILTLETANRLS